MKFYKLDPQTREPIPAEDVLDWASWSETADRVILQTTVGDVEISTIFIGLDYNRSRVGPPILYETMVFGGSLNGQGQRYATEAEARKGHESMAARVWARWANPLQPGED